MTAYTTLVDSADLSAHLDDPGWTIVDCRFKLGDPAWGERQYAEGHIPRAVYADLERDLSGIPDGTNGRHPLPVPAVLAATLGRLGIDAGTQVIVYDQNNAMFASRFWWLLRWLGHRNAAVLDGGFDRWIAEGRVAAHGIERRTERRFTGAPSAAMVADAATVAARRADPDWRLVDARAPERYRGEVEPIDRVPGHIPGAVNYFYGRNVDAKGAFLPSGELRQQLEQAIGGPPPDRVICYCGSGVTACQNLLALEHAGLPGAKLYPGSWSEWVSDAARPVERTAPATE